MFAHGAGRRVDVDEDGKPGACSDAVAHGKALQTFERGRTNKAHRLDAKRAGHGDAKPEQPLPRSACRKGLPHGGNGSENRLRTVVGQLLLLARDNLAGEIDQRGAGETRRQLHAERIGARCIQRQQLGWLAATHAVVAHHGDEAGGLEFARQCRNRLCCQSNGAGNIGAGNGTKPAHGFEHNPPVIGAAKFLVRADQRHGRPLGLATECGVRLAAHFD